MHSVVILTLEAACLGVVCVNACVTVLISASVFSLDVEWN